MHSLSAFVAFTALLASGTATAASADGPSNKSAHSIRGVNAHRAVQRQVARDARSLNVSSPVLPARLKKRAGGQTTNKVRGVSLGGWLVSEPFITPSLYEAANKKDSRIMDEFTFCKYQPVDVATEALTNHWKTWITREDLQRISEAGLTHVRIPIGFWALDVADDEHYIQGSLLYLIQACAWAKEFGLEVYIDLHSAPGSQNGFDNSGKRGVPQWHTSTSNVARTENVLLALTVEFSKDEYKGVVTGITPLNEPGGYRPGITEVAMSYYEQGYKLVRSVADNSLLYFMHDAFKPFSFWDGFMNSAPYENTALDTHIYTVFSDFQIAMGEDERLAYYCELAEPLRKSDANLRTIVGEWTLAPTDCSQKMPWITYSNKEAFGKQIGSGAHYDGTLPDSVYVGSCEGKSTTGDKFSDEYKVFLRKLFEVQTTAYEAGTGWILWSWKMETADDWSYEAGLRYGWIPQDPSEKLYPDLCST